MKKSEKRKLVEDLIWAAYLQHGRWKEPGGLIKHVFSDRLDDIKELTLDDFQDVRRDRL